MDSNIVTYVALFEGYLCEGTRAELGLAIGNYHRITNHKPDSNVLHEVEALRVLYLIDDQAHFDWLFSDVGLEEILSLCFNRRGFCGG